MIILLTGVAGAGKTTVGRQLAAGLGWPFYDADSFHSLASIDKMAKGVPLQDEDRWPWLERLRDHLRRCLDRGESAVLACSALKESYRRYLLIDPKVKLVFLDGDKELFQQRLAARGNHFMKPFMVETQLASLEIPSGGLHLDAAMPVSDLVSQIVDFYHPPFASRPVHHGK